MEYVVELTGKTAKRPHANARIVDVIVVGVAADARSTHTIYIIIKYLCHVSFYALILFKWIICHLWPNKDFVSLSLSCNSIIHCCDTAATATAAGVSADRFIYFFEYIFLQCSVCFCSQWPAAARRSWLKWKKKCSRDVILLKDFSMESILYAARTSGRTRS